MEPALDETLPDPAVGPALVPLGLHRDDLQVIAVVDHALHDVDDHASQRIIITTVLRALQVSERVVVDVLSQDYARLVTVLRDAGQNRDIILIDGQIGPGVRLLMLASSVYILATDTWILLPLFVVALTTGL